MSLQAVATTSLGACSLLVRVAWHLDVANLPILHGHSHENRTRRVPLTGSLRCLLALRQVIAAKRFTSNKVRIAELCDEST